MLGGWNSLKFFFFTVLATIVLLSVFLTTDMGKSKLIGLVLSYVNEKEYKIKIDNIESYFPLKVHFRSVKVYKEGKTQVALSGVYLESDLRAIYAESSINGRVVVDECMLWVSSMGQGAKGSLPNLSADIQVSCPNVVLKSNGHSIKSRLSGAHVVYDHKNQDLQFFGVLENITDLPVNLSFKGVGNIHDFALELDLKGKLVDWDGFKFDEIDGHSQLTHLPFRAHGETNINFTHSKSTGQLHFNVLQNQDAIQFNQIHLEAEGARLDGDVELNLANYGVKGTFSTKLVRHPLLNLLKPHIDADDLEADSVFVFDGSDLNLDLKVLGHGVTVQDHKIDGFEASIKATHVLSMPEGTFNLKGSHVKGPFAQLSEVGFESSFKDGIGAFQMKLLGPLTDIEIQGEANLQKMLKTLKLNSMHGAWDGIDLSLLSPCELSYGDHVWKMNLARIQMMRSQIDLEAVVKGGALDLKANGELDLLAVSRIFLDQDDVLMGTAKVDLKVFGELDRLSFDGTIDVNNAVYENVIYGTSIKNISLQAKADKKSLSILKATGQDGGSGAISASGQIYFSERGFDLALKASNFTVLHGDRMSLTAREVDLSLKGPLAQPLLAGFILVDDASYSIAPQIKSERRQLNIINPVPHHMPDMCKTAQLQTKPRLFNPKLELQIKFPPVLKIHGRGLSSIWKGKLDVTQTYEQPLIRGKLTADTGDLNFLGQTMILRKGSIRFDNSEDNIPYIDAKGVLDKPDLEVTVGIVGRVNKPNIELESQPSLPKDEILSYLFFGKDKSKLSPLEAVQLARALAAYKGFGPDTEFLNIITDNLGLDQLTFGSGATEGTYTVKVSKRLGDRVRVSLDQGMNPEDSKVGVEIDVTKNVSVKAEHGFAGSADGVSVNYNWDY